MIASSRLEPGVAHVWRVTLGDARAAAAMRPLLSDDERARSDRFYTEDLRMRYTVAHGWKRRIVGAYAGVAPEALVFVEGEHGKPSLARPAIPTLHFNLSHSADVGLIAVSADGPIGVDVERWDRETDHLRLAEHFFSEAEREDLRELAADSSALVAGFFAAWTRKEAYLKATGLGITRGLHHFDVSLRPDSPARLLADRNDPTAASVWAMAALAVGEGYSGAVVARAPLKNALVLDASAA